MKLFGSLLCPDCPPVIKMLKNRGVDFEFVNINESMENLKSFLALRDNRFEFNEIKSDGKIGIPCMVLEDGKVIFEDGIVEMFDK